MDNRYKILSQEFFVKSDKGYYRERRTIDKRDIVEIHEEIVVEGKARMTIILKNGDELITLPYNVNDKKNPYKFFR